MVLGFKKRFVEKWLSGQKKHTIREDKNNRWKAGRVAQFATGVRTKLYNCFMVRTCQSVQLIEISREYGFVKIDGILLPPLRHKELVLNDGFDSVDDFYLWFNKDFYGKIIHFTDLKY
jgi:uncharacterized protein YqfB (UPF0267 family)